MKPLDWSYVAGFFDGEGYACVRRTKDNGLSFQAGMAQGGPEGKSVFDDMMTFFAARGIKADVYRHSRSVNKQMWALRIVSRDSLCKFLEAVLPYLRIKKVQSQDILRFFRIYPPLKKYYCRNMNAEKARVPLDVLVAEYQSGTSIRSLTLKYDYRGVATIYQRFRKNGVPLRRLRKARTRRQ